MLMINTKHIIGARKFTEIENNQNKLKAYQ